jgi:hypothetical protein
VRGLHNEIGRQQTPRVEQDAAPAERPSAAKWWHWPLVSIGVAALAVIALFAVDFAPASWQKYIIVFEAVAAVVFYFNPAWFRRRMASYALSAGLLGGALSGALNLKVADATSLSWDSGPSAVFYLTMLAVIVYLLWMDEKAGRAYGRNAAR